MNTRVRNKVLLMLQGWLAMGLLVIPLVFSKQTFEWFDFPKQLVWLPWIAVGAVLLSLLHLAESSRPLAGLGRRMTVALAVLVGSYALSVLGSRSIWASVFGSQGRVQGSAIALAGYLALFVITYASVKSRSRDSIIQYSLILSSVVQSLLAIGQRAGWQVLGINTFGQGVGTLGMPSTLALFSVAGALGAVTAGLREPRHQYKGIWFALGLICASGVVSAGVGAGWILAGVAAVYLIFILPWGAIKPVDIWYLLAFGVLMGMAGLVVNTPWLHIGRYLASDSMLDLSTGWNGAAHIARVYPWFGSGPETFSFVYPAFKPVLLNLGQGWTYSVTYPFNEVFALLSHTGYVGVLAFLFFLGVAARALRCFERPAAGGDTAISPATLWTALWVVCAAFWFLSGSSVVSSILFWMSLAVSLGLRDQTAAPAASSPDAGSMPEEAIRQLETRLLLCGVVGSLVIVAVAFFSLRWFLADSAFTRQYLLQTGSESTEADVPIAYADAVKAADLCPWHERYLQSAGMWAMNLADTKRQKDGEGNPTILTKEAYAYYDEAKGYLRKVTEIDPSNASGWAGRAQVLLHSSDGQQIPREVAAYYEKAAALEPTNAQYYYALAMLADQTGPASLVESYLRLSLGAKPDWVTPRYDLSKFLEQAGRYEEAYQELSVIQQFLESVAAADTDKQTIADDLARVQALLPATTGTAGQEVPAPGQ